MKLPEGRHLVGDELFVVGVVLRSSANIDQGEASFSRANGPNAGRRARET